ncbi:MAG: BrnT family toxin [Candidatus Rokubacteria bacterium]|nr:BrnT family toxin [Candidatus Rokubacteria bacterium]
MTFEWDEKKAAQNLKTHGVSFKEGSAVFRDPLSITTQDTDHSTPDGERLVTIGQSDKGRTLVVVHSERGDTIRIITARKAMRREREAYEEGS